MTQRIGAVSADFEANTASFDRNIKKATSNLRTNAAQMNKSLAGLEAGFNGVRRLAGTFGVALGVGALVSFGRRALAAAGNLQDTADKIGFTTDELQKLRFAAEQSGVAVTALDMGLQRFSRRIGEAAQGQGELIKTARQYNVAVQNSVGTMRSNVDILRDFADVIQNAGSEQEQLRIAFKLFDSEGAALVNTLRDGATGLDAMMNSADEFGAVMSQDLIAQAKEADDKITALERSFGTLATTVVARAAPGISTFIDWLRRLGQESDTLEKIAEAQRQLEMFQRMPRSLFSPREDMIRRAQERLDALRFSGQGDFGPASGAATGGTKPLGDPAADKKAAEAQQKVIEKLQFETAQLVRTNEEQELYNNLKAAGVELNSAAGQRIADLTASLQVEQAAWDQAKIATEAHDDAILKLVSDAASISEATRTPMEEYQAALVRINELLAEGVISQDTYNRRVVQLQDELARADPLLKALEDSSRDFGNSLTAAFEDAIIEGKSFGEVLRSLGQDLARLALRAATSKLISTGISALFGAAIGGGAFAEGGRPPVGKWSIVGEEGPELFKPDVAGRIIPNDELGMAGGGTVNNFSVDMRGASVEAVQRLERFVNQINGSLESRAVGAVFEEQRRNGRRRVVT